MKSLLDPTFRYVPAAATDLRKTFARIRREQAIERARREREQQQHPVVPISMQQQRRK